MSGTKLDLQLLPADDRKPLELQPAPDPVESGFSPAAFAAWKMQQSTIEPAKAGRAWELARRNGLDPNFALSNFDDLQAQQEKVDTEALLRQDKSGKLAALLQEPAAGAAVKANIADAAWWQRLVTGRMTIYPGGVPFYQPPATYQALERGVQSGVTSGLQTLNLLGDLFGEPVPEDQLTDENAGPVDYGAASKPEEWLYKAIGFLPAMAPRAAVGAALAPLGGPVAAAAGTFAAGWLTDTALMAAPLYEQLRSQTDAVGKPLHTDEEAAAIALGGAAGAAVVTSGLATAWLKGLAGKSVMSAAEQAAKNAVVYRSASKIASDVAVAGLKHFATGEAYIMFQAGAQAAIASAAGGSDVGSVLGSATQAALAAMEDAAGPMILMVGIPSFRDMVAEKGKLVRRAEDVRRFQILEEAAGKSSADPTVIRRVMAELHQGEAVKDVSTVYVNLEALRAVAEEKGTSVELLAQRLVPASVYEASRTTGQLPVPVADYAALVVKGGLHELLKDDVKFDPEGFTARESKHALALVAKIHKLIDEAVAAKEDPETENALAHVHAELRAKAIGAGRKVQEAENFATLGMEHTATMAVRQGITVEQAWAESPLNKPLEIRSGAPSFEQVMGSPDAVRVDQGFRDRAAARTQYERMVFDRAFIAQLKAEQNPEAFTREDAQAILAAARLQAERDRVPAAPAAAEAGPVDQLFQGGSLRIPGRGEQAPETLPGLADIRSVKIRDIAQELAARTRAKYGAIDPTDHSPEAADRVAHYIAEEVAFEYQQGRRETSGAGWYTEKFQRALDAFSVIHPELRTDQGSRDLFTALIAVTSDGQEVRDNLKLALQLYNAWKTDGALPSKVKAYRPAVGVNVRRLQEFIKTDGLEGLRKILLEEAPVSDLAHVAKALGYPFKSQFTVDTKLPFASVIFGPKLGTFFANLMGTTGYLTMDRWMSRTINRYRGDLLPEVIGTEARGDQFDSKGRPQGLARFKALLQRRGEGDAATMSDLDAMSHVYFHWKNYEAKDFKNGTALEKAANTIAKAAWTELNDTPNNASDRSFWIQATHEARAKLAEQGIDISIADIQAVLWYFEKRLYADLGGEPPTDVTYLDVAHSVIVEDLLRREAASGRPDLGVGGKAAGKGAGGAAADARRAEAAARVAGLLERHGVAPADAKLNASSWADWRFGPDARTAEAAKLLKTAGVVSPDPTMVWLPSQLPGEGGLFLNPADQQAQFETMKLRALGARLGEQALEGGFTYDPRTGDQPSTGYALSPFKDRELVVPADKVDEATVLAYLSKNHDLFRSDSRTMLGGWHNEADGNVYLDVSVVVKDPIEAAKVARAHGQLAYFDLERHTEVRVDAVTPEGGPSGGEQGGPPAGPLGEPQGPPPGGAGEAGGGVLRGPHGQEGLGGLQGEGAPDRGGPAGSARPAVEVLHQGAGPEFYSPAERAVKQAKQKAGTPESWYAVVSRSPGVKLEELEARQFKAALQAQAAGGKTITREQAMQALADHSVQVDVVELGAQHPFWGRWWKALEPIGAQLGLKLHIPEEPGFGPRVSHPSVHGGEPLTPESLFFEGMRAGVFPREGSPEWATGSAPVRHFLTAASGAGLGSHLRILLDGKPVMGRVPEVAAQTLLQAYESLTHAGAPPPMEHAIGRAIADAQSKVDQWESVVRHTAAAAHPGQPYATHDSKLRYQQEQHDRAQAMLDLYRPALEQLQAWHPVLNPAAKMPTTIEGRSGHENRVQPTHYSQYTTPGAPMVPGSYRELLFKSPVAASFDAPHFGDNAKGLLAHARVYATEEPSGKRVLVVDEVQSDLHQQGRETGYKPSPEAVQAAREKMLSTARAYFDSIGAPVAAHDDVLAHDLMLDAISGTALEKLFVAREAGNAEAAAALEARAAYRDLERNGYQQPPDVPWKGDAWAGLVVRRLLRYAADNGFAKIALASSEIPVARWGTELVAWEKMPRPGPAELLASSDALDWFAEKTGWTAAKVAKEFETLHNFTGVIQDAMRAAGNTPVHAEVKRHWEALRATVGAAEPDKPTWRVHVSSQHGGNAGGINLEQEGLARGLVKQSATPVIDEASLRRAMQTGGLSEEAAAKVWERMQKSDVGTYAPRAEGMQSFYDKKLPGILEKLIAKDGGSLRKERLLGTPEVTSVEKDPEASGWWRVTFKDGNSEVVAADSEAHARDRAILKRETGPNGEAPPNFWTAELPQPLLERTRQEGVSLFQAQQEEPALRGEVRGSLVILHGPEGKTYQIHLGEGADQSTLLHETMHVLVDSMGDVLARGTLPKELATSYESLLKWMGYEGGAAERARGLVAAFEEKATSAWELFLASGAAPKESLQPAFDRMARWMARIYKGTGNIAAGYEQRFPGQGGVELAPEARKFFQQLLATDAELQQAAEPIGPQLESVVNGLPAPRQREVKQKLDAVDKFTAAQARRLLADQPLTNVRPGYWLSVERRAMQEAVRVQGSSDPTGVEDLLLNAKIARRSYHAARELQREAELNARALRAFGDETFRAKVGKVTGIGPDGRVTQPYLEQLDRLLAGFEFRDPLSETNARAATQAWLDAERAENRDPYLPDDILEKLDRTTHWKTLTPNQLQALRNSVENVAHLAKLKSTILEGRKRVEFDAAVQELDAKARESAPSVQRELAAAPQSIFAKIKAGAMSPLVLIRKLDGGDVNGPWHRFVYNVVGDARIGFHTLANELAAPVQSALQTLSSADLDRWKGTHRIPGLGEVPHEAAIAAALNVGNASNRQKMIEGWSKSAAAQADGLRWNDQTLPALLATLTSKDWDFVQLVWDRLEEKWPQMVDLEKRLSGLAPDKVETAPLTVQTADGQVKQLRGGYYPMRYDSRYAAERVSGDALFSPDYVRAATPQGHLQERVEQFHRPVRLTVLDAPRALSNVAKDLAMREAVISVDKLLANETIHGTIRAAAGEEAYTMTRDWLRDMVNDQVGDRSGIEALMMGARRAVTAGIFAYNIGQTLQNLASGWTVLTTMGPKWVAPAFARALADRAALYEQHAALSQEQALRIGSGNALTAELESAFRASKLKMAEQKFVSFGLEVWKTTDRFVSQVAWEAAFTKAMADKEVGGLGYDGELARRYADEQVNLRVMAGDAKDLPAMMRGKYGRILLPLSGYAFNRLNQVLDLNTSIAQARREGVKNAAWKLTAALVGGLAGESLLSDLAMGRGPKDENDDGVIDGHDWVRWAASSVAWGFPKYIPVVGNMVRAFEQNRDVGGSPETQLYSLPARAANDIAKLAGTAWTEGLSNVEQEQVANVVFDILTGVATYRGLPVAQARATGGYAYDVATGAQQPESLAEALAGLTWGPKRSKTQGSLKGAIRGY